ncbi:hypothetical protein BKA93DRAFT_783441 [Sparassis latifolia]
MFFWSLHRNGYRMRSTSRSRLSPGDLVALTHRLRGSLPYTALIPSEYFNTCLSASCHYTPTVFTFIPAVRGINGHRQWRFHWHPCPTGRVRYRASSCLIMTGMSGLVEFACLGEVYVTACSIKDASHSGVDGTLYKYDQQGTTRKAMKPAMKPGEKHTYATMFCTRYSLPVAQLRVLILRGGFPGRLRRTNASPVWGNINGTPVTRLSARHCCSKLASAHVHPCPMSPCHTVTRFMSDNHRTVS